MNVPVQSPEAVAGDGRNLGARTGLGSGAETLASATGDDLGVAVDDRGACGGRGRRGARDGTRDGARGGGD